MAGGYANASSLQVQTSYRCALHLGELLRPFLLRRLKADVANELPAKHEQVLFCQLGPYQRQLYEFLLDSEIIQSVLAGQRNILAGIDLLRKACNHPHLLSLEATADVLDWPGCPVPFGDVSGTLAVVGQVLRLWRQGGHRVLLFCQTRQMLDIVEEHVIGLGFTYLRMDGTTPVKGRGQLVDRFNGDPAITVFLLTTKVGGLGLNLIGADRVLIYDPDWNPSTDLQARERAWRLGQRRPVTIYRLITAGTIEEKIYHRQIFKQYLTNRILKDPKQSRFFKTSDLYDLFTLAPPHESNATETGELFSGLGLEIKRRLNREERREGARETQEATASATPKDDSHILESLFEMTGLHSAIQHDRLVEKPRHEAVLVEREAARIAKEAADALRRSREERLERSVEEVTWTGGPRFKPPVIPVAKMPKAGLPSSADILATIRQRNDAKKQEGPILDKSLANILDRLLLFFDETGGVCKSEAIAERFKRILQPGQEAPFRHMLKTIARFDPLSKSWHLQRSLFDEDDSRVDLT
jgi:DNA excision repair protein ERCC-6